MRFRIPVLLLLAPSLLFVGCQKVPPQEPETIVFGVSGMMCEDGCAVTVRELLVRQPGVLDAEVDFPAAQATVIVRPEVFDPQAAIKSLADYKYVATFVDPEAEPTEQPSEEPESPDAAPEG